MALPAPNWLQLPCVLRQKKDAVFDCACAMWRGSRADNKGKLELLLQALPWKQMLHASQHNVSSVQCIPKL